jgi:isoprenylcysteine carboxyl methyltransferase (ICMT) family protein YpbQ
MPIGWKINEGKCKTNKIKLKLGEIWLTKFIILPDHRVIIVGK